MRLWRDRLEVFKYFWLLWMTVGHYPSANYNFFQTIHLAYILFTNVATLTMLIVEIFYVSSLPEFLHNFPMNICLIICALKFATIVQMRKKSLMAEDQLARLYRVPLTAEQEGYLLQDSKTIKRLEFLLMFCYVNTNVSMAVNAIYSNRQKLLFEVWLPWEWKGTYTVYWCTFAFSCLSQFILATQNVMNDMNGPVYLMVLNTHLKIIMERIESMAADPKKSHKENERSLIACLEDHRVIVEILNMLQDTMSFVIFWQFVGTVLTFTTSALIYLFLSPSISELMHIGFFMISEILEILPTCYYSNELMASTDNLVTAFYSCDWTGQSLKFKKTMIIIMQMTQRPQLITAGKVIPVTLGTFVSIMRVTYSLLAIMRNIR